MSEIKNYKELIVWQKSFALVTEIYALTKNFPDEERYGFISQVRRSAVSIPSNIAEGRGRGTNQDYARFISIAYSSAAELETLLLLAKEIGYMNSEQLRAIIDNLDEISRMLNKLRINLKS